MIVAAIVWLIGIVCAVAIGLSINHSVDDGEPRYSGREIGLISVFWPLAVLALGVAIVLAKVKAVRS